MHYDEKYDRLFWVWFCLIVLMVFGAIDGSWLRDLDKRLQTIEHVQPVTK